VAVVAAALVAACAEKKNVYVDVPTTEQMRTALKELLAKRPDIAIPEFELSVNESPAIQHENLVRIGAFDCDPEAQMFYAVFSAPNLTMQQLVGRFERDARRMWRAVVIRSSTTTDRDTTRRADWYPTDSNVFSWSQQRDR
jgi:hypothetical protein